MKFKVRDWVVSGMDIGSKPYQLTEENWSEDVAHWYPKEGDTIIVTDDTKVYIVKFLGMSDEKFVCVHLDGCNEAFTKVEPFIGSIPSFVFKGKRNEKN